MSDKDDIAPDARVYRHAEPVGDPEFAIGDEALIEDITKHLESHLGEVAMVYHEIISQYVHVDVHHFPPTPERPFHVLATSGMSQRAMTTPPELSEDWRHAELLVNLPSDWPITQEAFEDERNYWPVRCLKSLARFPHIYGTWLGYAHSVPNGDPPEPFAENTTMSGCMLVPPLTLPDVIHQLTRPSGQVVRFWNLLPLHADEMDFKIRKGSDALFERLDEVGVNDIIDPTRASVVGGKRWWPF